MAITKVTNPVTDFDKSTNLPGLKIPSGNNTNEPAIADSIQGMIRNNTDETTESSDSAIAHYNGTAWKYFAATQSYPTSLLMDLDASDTNSYPGTGTIWYDLTLNGNNGALTSTSWNSSGYFDFNGSTSYVTTGLTWPGSTKLSFSAWFRLDTLNANQYITGDFNSAGANAAFRFAAKITSGNMLEVGTNNGGIGTFFSFGSIAGYLNTWTNITVTVDGSAVRVYLQGVQFGGIGSGATILSAGSNPLNIGVYGPGSNKHNFNGYISKARFYNVVLTQAEITTLYDEGR